MSQRIPRVNSLIKKEIAKLLSKEVDFPKNTLVTVSRVDCSPNLIQAKVYVSCLPQEREREAFKILKRNIWFLQKKLDKILKMRPVPKIIFVQDKQAEKATRVEELLERIKRGNGNDF